MNCRISGGERGLEGHVWNLRGGEEFVAKAKKKGFGLPGEGVYYDPITYSKLWDRSTRRVSLGLTKTFHLASISNFLERTVPTVFDVGCRLISGPCLLGWRPRPGKSMWLLDWKYEPVFRAGLSVQLLDLASADGLSKGYLKFRAGLNSLGRRERGFELDRTYKIPKIELASELRIKDNSVLKTFDTRLYGEVIAKKISQRILDESHSRWSMKSTFGFQQSMLFFDCFLIRCRVGMGLRPDGTSSKVFDFK